MKTFLAVASEGSFTAAAQRVALTQAAVGLQMRALEEEMRRPLFERQGKAVMLSAAGRELLPSVQRLVELYERIVEAPDPLRSMSGTVHLGIISSALQPLVRCMLDLRRDHPALDLRVSMARPLDLVHRVEAGELDAAITTRHPTPGSDIAWTTLYSEPMVMIAHAATAPRGVRELLREQPYIGFDAREPTGQLIQRTLRRLRTKPPRMLLEISATDAIVELVRAGLGVAVVPHLASSDWHRDPRLRIIALPEAREGRQIALAQRRTDSGKAVLIGAVADEFLRRMRSALDREVGGLWPEGAFSRAATTGTA